MSTYIYTYTTLAAHMDSVNECILHTDGEWSATLLVLNRRVTLSGTDMETGVKVPLDLHKDAHHIKIPQKAHS